MSRRVERDSDGVNRIRKTWADKYNRITATADK